MKEITYKGLKGLVLENDVYKVVVLPDFGGKLASFYDKKSQFELIYEYEGDTLTLPDKYGDFGSSKPCGIDDCWPNIDACDGLYGDEKITYPDHGDVWFRKFDYELEGDSVVVKMQSDLLPYTYKKVFTLSVDGLTIGHEISAIGDHGIEGFYTFHGLMVCEADMEFLLPKEVTQVLNVHHSSDILGLRDRVHPYPLTKDLRGKPYRLDRTAGPEANKCEKFYCLDKVKTGKCGVYYPRLQGYAIIEFDQEVLPYLGLWLNEKADGKTFNFALEPSNGFYDNLKIAKRNGKCPTLAAGEDLVFEIKIAMSDQY